jgi:hypothetical protein
LIVLVLGDVIERAGPKHVNPLVAVGHTRAVTSVGESACAQ